MSADVYKEIYDQDFPVEGISSGWIQWKGTYICVDVHCVCGYHDHIDGEFFYNYECAGCGRKFAVGHNIKLIELKEGQFDDTTTFHKDDEGETEGDQDESRNNP